MKRLFLSEIKVTTSKTFSKMTALVVLATQINGVFRSVDHALKHKNRGIIFYINSEPGFC